MRGLAKICPNCGTRNQRATKFCENCGTKLSTDKNTLPEKVQNKGLYANIKDKWANFTNIQRGVVIIGIIFVFIVVPAIIYGSTRALTESEYVNEILQIDEQFRTIVKDNSLYTFAGRPWREEEADLKLMLEKLENMKKRGIPEKYKEFHVHYTKTIEYYILKSNSASGEYKNEFYEENNKSNELWKNLGNTVTQN